MITKSKTLLFTRNSIGKIWIWGRLV